MTTTGRLITSLADPAGTMAAVIITALVALAACGGDQSGTPAKPPVAPGPTATGAPSKAVEPTWTPSPTAGPTMAPAQSTAPSNTPARDTAATPGEKTFQDNCAVCHGTSGEGQPDWHVKKPDGILPAPPLNGDGHTWHHGDGTLYTYVSQGGAFYESPDIPSFKSGMPAFGEALSHDEIIAVLEYVKNLWGEKFAEGFGVKKRESQTLVSENDPYPEP